MISTPAQVTASTSCLMCIFVSSSFEPILPAVTSISAALYKKFCPSIYTRAVMIVLYSVKYRTSTEIIQVEALYNYHSRNHNIIQHKSFNMSIRIRLSPCKPLMTIVGVVYFTLMSSFRITQTNARRGRGRSRSRICDRVCRRRGRGRGGILPGPAA